MGRKKGRDADCGGGGGRQLADDRGLRGKGRRRGRKQVSEADHAAEVRELNRVLAPMELRVHDVPSDGNCLFSAVSDQLCGDCRRARELRARCVEELERSRADFEPFVAYEDGEDYDSYISSMARDGEWGGALELQAMAQMLRVDIIIHAVAVPRRELRVPFSERVIHVSYHLGEHYCSVRFTGTDTEAFARRWGAPVPEGAAQQRLVEAAALCGGELRPLIDAVRHDCPWLCDGDEPAVAAQLLDNDWDCEAVIAWAVAAHADAAPTPGAAEAAAPAAAPASPAAADGPRGGGGAGSRAGKLQARKERQQRRATEEAAAAEPEGDGAPPAAPQGREQKRAERKQRRADKEVERAMRRREKAAEMRAVAEPPPAAAPEGAVIVM